MAKAVAAWLKAKGDTPLVHTPSYSREEIADDQNIDGPALIVDEAGVRPITHPRDIPVRPHEDGGCREHEERD